MQVLNAYHFRQPMSDIRVSNYTLRETTHLEEEVEQVHMPSHPLTVVCQTSVVKDAVELSLWQLELQGGSVEYDYLYPV